VSAPLLVLLLVVAADPSSEAVDHPPPLSPGTRALLRFAADADVSLARRADAIREVGERGETAAVPRLAAMLPGELGRDTMEVVVALGKIGGPKALAALKAFEAKVEKDGIRLHGKINACLDGAISRLQEKSSRK
jgi:hypothetical protein